MKKIYIILATLLVTGLSSCDMEKYPYSSVEESQYLATMNDFTNARIGIYSYYRSITTGGYILTPELQCDDFHATAGFSNSYGNQYRWDFQSSDGNVEGVWQNHYAHIARCNYFIDGYNKVLDGTVTDLSDANKELIAAYAGEAYFTRAYNYFQLVGYFCKAYNPATADSDLGLPLQLAYSPTSDASAYPGRSSLKATYEQILSDLTEAKKLVNTSKTVTQAQNVLNYISQDIVTAFQARVALQMKDYTTAISNSTSLINTGKYPLLNSEDGGEAFRNMWVKDTGSEVIWQIYMSADELGSATGTSFWGQYKKDDPSSQVMDYIPSQKLIDLYEQDRDIRFAAYFAPFTLKVSTGATGDIYVFDKYPGNPDIYNVVSVDNHYTNKSKPFRISEQYLIAAEAYVGNNDIVNGAKYLNLLRASRLVDYVDVTYNSPNTLLADIQDERHKELVGEGFRLTDLKRWGLGVNREDATQDAALVLLPGGTNTTALTKTADDFRMVWPIPKSETDVNPQIKGQQNPGY